MEVTNELKDDAQIIAAPDCWHPKIHGPSFSHGLQSHESAMKFDSL